MNYAWLTNDVSCYVQVHYTLCNARMERTKCKLCIQFDILRDIGTEEQQLLPHSDPLNSNELTL